jgi:DNA polymerase-1
VPLPCELQQLVRQDPDAGTLRGLFEKLEFKRLLKEIEGIVSETAGTSIAPSHDVVSRENYRLLTEPKELTQFLARVREKRLPLSLDLETTSRDPMLAEIVGIALCAEIGQSVYIPVAHENASIAQPNLQKVLEILRPVVQDENIGKRGQHIKYDDVVLRKYGVEIKGISFDSMLASYLLTPEVRSGHDLDSLAHRYLGHTNITYDEVTKGIPDGAFAAVPIEKALLYSGEDADVALRLEEVMRPLLTAEGCHGISRHCRGPAEVE